MSAATRLRIRNLTRMALACSCGDSARGYISPESRVPEFCAVFLTVHRGPEHRVTGEGFLPAPARPVCNACLDVLHRQVPATRGDMYGRGSTWCDEHALPGDPPLTTTDTATRRSERRHDGWPLSALQEIEGY